MASVDEPRALRAPGRVPPARRQVRRRVAVWMCGSIVGGAVLALPDSGPRLVSFSRDHGPSAVDALGIAVLVGAWIPVVHLLWTRRAAIRGAPAWWAVSVAGIGAAVLVVSVALDLGPTWVAAAALLLAAQVVMLAAVSRATD